MTYIAVLDACVLYPFSLRDTLLRLSERELCDARWSDRILGEVTRNLIEKRISEVQAQHLEQAIRDAFPEAIVPEADIAGLEDSMTNDVKDRHVLAAAVAAGASTIITFKLSDFPASACRPHGVTAIHPDDFLLTLVGAAPNTVAGVIAAQAGDLHNPPTSRDELLAMLQAAGVPNFAARLTGIP